MIEKEFNLLEEPWLLVMTAEGKVEEHNLPDVLVNSHKYRRLAGELPTQDFAILRLLLAVVQTVVYRYDTDGKESLLDESADALERWKTIWVTGHLPEALIRSYLDTWKERFWLFHPKRPFYQVPEASVGTEAGAAKLNGAISESNNKARLFSNRSGNNKDKLTFSEAARWLIYLNGFDDTSAKPKGKGLPSAGAGWLGKIGIVHAEGNNLFETIMLNTVLIDAQDKCWKFPNPVWELSDARSGERIQISIPDNQAELLTLQSRRIMLRKSGSAVTGYYLLGGDFFDRTNALNEQMTFWKVSSEKDGSQTLTPKRNDPSRQLWRDFSNLTNIDKEHFRPGVVTWIKLLKNHRLLGDKKVCFRNPSVQYGDKDFFVTDIFGDSVVFHLALLDEVGNEWNKLIQSEISICEKAASIMGFFAKYLQLAAGAEQNSQTQIEYAKEQFYYRIDIPFKNWLEKIDPDAMRNAEVIQAEWRTQACEIAEDLGRELFLSAGTVAFVGRLYKRNKDDSGYYYSSPDLFNKFMGQIYKCFDMKNVKEVLNGEN